MHAITATALLILVNMTLVSADILAYDNFQCQSRSFYHRPELDNTFYSQKVITEIGSLDSSTECFQHCLMADCNTVLYKEDTGLCRLYSGTDNSSGSSESGWLYYGVSCVSYSPDNTIPDSDIQTDNADDVCDVDYHALITCPPTTCFKQGTWMLFNIVCTPTLFMVDPANVNSSSGTVIDLPFELQPGHVISLQLTGNEMDQSINLEKDENILLHVTIRLNQSPRQVAFNTKRGESWGTEESMGNIPINDVNNYNIDIHIMDTEFKTYGDGDHMMTNQMRMNFTGVKVIRLVNCPTFYKLKVGYNRC